MENDAQESNSERVVSFCEITSSTKEEALFFLESHNWDLDSAVTTFYDNTASITATIPSTDAVSNPIPAARSSPPAHSPDYTPSQSPSRSRSPSPSPSRVPYALRSRRTDKRPTKKTSSSRSRGVRTIADLNRPASSDSDSDDAQELYAGGDESGILVHFPRKDNDVDSMFDQLAQSGVAREVTEHLQPSSNSKFFTGKARMLSGETVSGDPQPLESVTHSITFWRNGFSVNDGPLRRMDDPQNASFLESIKRSECPKELEPADRRTAVHVSLVKLDEDYPEPVKQRDAFQGLGRTLGSSSSTPSAASEPTLAVTSLNSAPLPSRRLVLDESSPLISIQLRLADGTRMVSRFNNHHTIRDIRAFIDASRPGGPTSYQLQVMGFPPKKLTELDQTIEQAGIANSVVIQRL